MTNRKVRERLLAEVDDFELTINPGSHGSLMVTDTQLTTPAHVRNKSVFDTHTRRVDVHSQLSLKDEFRLE